MEDYLFQKFNTVVWKTAKKKERKEMSTKTMMQSEKKMSKSGRSDRHACSGSGDPDAF